MTSTNIVPELAANSSDGDTDPSEPNEVRADVLLEVLDSRSTPDLEPIHPAESLELYLSDKEREYQSSTIKSHRSRLGFFIDWCAENDISNLNTVSSRDVQAFKIARREELNLVSEKSLMDTMRVFFRWCASIDAVEPGLAEKIESPTLAPGMNSRETVLEPERAREILHHLARFAYASIEHVVWVLLVKTGMRLGDARALDIGDYYADETTPYVDLKHRPETGTPIKNKQSGERPVALPSEVCSVLDDYLEVNHPGVTDSHGRTPLLASQYGRVGTSTIRRYVYKWSRPCVVTNTCPHDREKDSCDALGDVNQASDCPSSVTPHPIRRGYITHARRSDVPAAVISARCDVSLEVIEQHYDVRSDTEKMQQRSDVLSEIFAETDGYV